MFGPLYVAMVRAGEAGGVLEQSLDRTADQLEKDDNLRRQVKGAMTYPAVVLTFALGVLLALIAFIVPVFVGIFKDFGGKLPFITQVTVNLSQPGHAAGGTSCSFGSVALVVGFRKWKKSEWGRPQWDRFRLRIAGQHRQDGPEDRARALVAHVLGPLLRRRADHAGDRGDAARPPATPWSSGRWTT